MIIRPYTTDDLEAISTIYDNYYASEYELPNLDKTLTNAIIDKDGKVIGFGLVKLWAEAIMILDKKESVRNKVASFNGLMNHAINASKYYKIDKLHAVILDPTFKAIMEKHFKFQERQGVTLVREIEDA